MFSNMGKCCEKGIKDLAKTIINTTNFAHWFVKVTNLSSSVFVTT